MENVIIILIAVAIVGLAGRYIYKKKKQGAKCIGCPSGCNCSGGSCCCDGKK